MAALGLALLAGCREAPAPVEPAVAPYRIEDVSVTDRVVSLDLVLDTSYTPQPGMPTALVVLFSGKEDADVRLVGSFRGTGYSRLDENLGAEVTFTTVLNPELENPYLGAWWYGPLEHLPPAERQRVRMELLQFADGGRIEGAGYLTIAVVSGRLARQDFALLSEPVVVPYEAGEPAPFTLTE
jgi:hypothetical protein